MCYAKQSNVIGGNCLLCGYTTSDFVSLVRTMLTLSWKSENTILTVVTDHHFH